MIISRFTAFWRRELRFFMPEPIYEHVIKSRIYYLGFIITNLQTLY